MILSNLSRHMRHCLVVCLFVTLTLAGLGVVGLQAATKAPAAKVESDSGAVVVQAVRTSGDGKTAKFVLDVSRPVSFSVFALAEPYRLVIDLPDLDFEMAHSMAQVERGMVRNFRFGNFGDQRSRIVLDLNGPAKVMKAYSLPAVDDNEARLVIELSRVDEREFSEQSLRDVIRVEVEGAEAAKVATLSAHPLAKDRKDADPRPLVVLDPGHGGIDTGAVSPKGHVESKLVLAFALALRENLLADGRFRVAMTRETDTFISLSKRVAFARARHADLFVSIHADTVRQSYVRGATVYTLSDKASDAIAADLAHRENRSDLLAGLEMEEKDDVVADILIDLTRRETSNHSSLYSRTLVGALESSIRLAKRPQRSAGFKVLKAPDIPSVLLELGYLSNKEDQSALTSKTWQKKAIQSISKSIEMFFARRSTHSSGLFTKSSG
ncbi:N-acetylmuramoyl-L-alanine amidase [Cohaesibacter intestini]|uniref:N-acetylmuramoyl-L-alanine amidase n=1 Tax=Cohaesibacter intestini TaxID=2211145 RepID=UPI000DEAED40|nr:N-acetylmuramoyl-L-alanine amidase [Cohaesibacter intestini]